MSVKAYELIPALERLKLLSDKSSTQIHCIECCGKNLYLGTDDCFVIHYFIEEETSPSGKLTFRCEKQAHKYLALKKPVVQLKAASALNRILILCDAMLTMLNMFDLEPILGGVKVKGVTSFCLNENPCRGDPFSVEICVALKKKTVQVYSVTEDKMTLLCDISTTEPPVTMAMDGTHICMALANHYQIITYDNRQTQELFDYDGDHVHPSVTRIAKDEFLLSAPGALGMFASANGISQRPPLQWAEDLIAVAYSQPYILALSDEFITVHSILDQQQKQSIPFQGGRYLGEFEGRIFVTSASDIYALVPIAFEKQIQSLLTDRRVTEALDLARNVRQAGLSKDKFTKMFRRVQQQAAFIEFSESHFEDATLLFKGGQVDVREVICLYPNLMSPMSQFVRSVLPLHEIADVRQLAKGDQVKVAEFKRFLLAYLEEARESPRSASHLLEIDTALLKLYAETNSPRLAPFVAVDNRCDVHDSATWLEKCACHHALAVLLRRRGDLDKALAIWTRIEDGQLSDSAYPGFSFLVNILANLSNHQLVWKYVDWLLEKNEAEGVKVFTTRPDSEPQTDRLRPDYVLDYLRRFPTAIIIYLEFVVFAKKSQKEKYHTHLAVLYLDKVLQMMKKTDIDDSELDRARCELRRMLQESSLYRVQLILGKVRETELHTECAILYAKLGEHEKALRILVHELRDYAAAEQYCRVNSEGRDLADRRRLFHLLLAVYLDQNNKRRAALVAPAVALLNNYKSDFDTVKVLQLLPDTWSTGLLSSFLTSAVRASVHGGRTTRIERMLQRAANLEARHAAAKMAAQSVCLADNSLCAVCKRGFSEPTFARYPNGVITHVHCAENRSVCPVTGQQFGAATK